MLIKGKQDASDRDDKPGNVKATGGSQESAPFLMIDREGVEDRAECGDGEEPLTPSFVHVEMNLPKEPSIEMCSEPPEVREGELSTSGT